ncbi:MAG TPA: pantetheine-phosphate adenylyltransferase [Actinomycetota bacterium]|nr:pantetheine-phosphate adenylyltransferase [Actinomycetota bacterium]
MGLTALCPGTFDPVTNGHLDIIERAARRFDALVVGVLDNPAKQPLFTAEERVGLLKEATSELQNVTVEAFSGLLVDYVSRRGADVVIKGLRAVTDFESEIQMAQMNHRLAGIETLFMTTSPQWSFLSSSLVKEVARFGGEVEGLVPPPAVERLAEKLQGTS